MEEMRALTAIRALAVGVAFSVVGSASAAVQVPALNDQFLPGDPVTITWDPLDGCGAVDIDLYQGNRLVCSVAAGTTDDGSFEWDVDDCGLDPACNLRLRIGCGAESTFSQRFAISGLLLDDIIPGDRKVELVWTRLAADTLGAGNAPTAEGELVFGGYNIWRQVFDNRLDEIRRERFTKIRSYDVRAFGSDTSSVAWNFERSSLPIGESDFVDEDEIIEEDEEPPVRVWSLAQSFTAEKSFDVCQARIFLGRALATWVFDVRIVGVADGIPVPDDIIAQTEMQVSATAFEWQSFTFPTPGTLLAGNQYALLVQAEPSTGNESFLFWVGSTFDIFDGGEMLSQRDAGLEWERRSDKDFSFVLGESTVDGCRDVIGQRLGGTRERRFRDSEDILAFERDEDLILSLVDVPGPYNGFQLRYAVTAFYRAQLSSGNIEKPSACEDTLFAPSGFPEGVQPTGSARWPDVVFPNSAQPESGPVSQLRDVYPVPNPYIRDSESASFPRWELPGERRIDFVNLPRGAKIRLTNLAAETVRIIEHTADHGTARWDLKNSSGEIVTSGVYLYFVTAPNGEKTNGQLIIVR